MNCHEAQHQIIAGRDLPSDRARDLPLEEHLSQCADCRRVRTDLAAVFEQWSAQSRRATVPDPEREWHAVRRQIRGGTAVGGAPRSRRYRSMMTWFAIPLAAAAVIAVSLREAPHPPAVRTQSHRAVQSARANSVEVPGNNASTMVFVDDKSGWLFVWASDTSPTGG